ANGTITHVGAAGEKVDAPADARVVDVTGLHIYPGMIDAGTVLGLVEIGSARETDDSRDGGDFQPDLRASVGINPDSELIPVTRANGVTTVVTRPTGSLVPGQGALINLAGWVPARWWSWTRCRCTSSTPAGRRSAASARPPCSTTRRARRCGGGGRRSSTGSRNCS